MNCKICGRWSEGNKRLHVHYLHLEVRDDGACTGIKLVENEHTHLHPLTYFEMTLLPSDVAVPDASVGYQEIIQHFLQEMRDKPVPTELARMIFYKLQSVKTLVEIANRSGSPEVQDEDVGEAKHQPQDAAQPVVQPIFPPGPQPVGQAVLQDAAQPDSLNLDL